MDTNNTRKEYIEIKTEKEWLNATKDVESDHHDNGYRLQLQFFNRHENNELSPTTGFLMVNDKGEVCTNGDRDDPRTNLEIVHNILSGYYWIICRGGKYSGNILYMDGHELLVKRMPRKPENDTTIFFQFLSRGEKPCPPFKISSYSGIPLKFDKEGMYIDKPSDDVTDYDDPYYFTPYRVNCTRYTMV